MDIDHLPEIPSIFYNSETKQPFTHCLICDCAVQEQADGYMIERAIRHYPEMQLENVIFEYAMCKSCVSKMQSELSDQTVLAISLYFMNAKRLKMRPDWTPERDEHNQVISPSFKVDEWVNECVIKGVPKADLTEYTVTASCIGNKIVPSILPYMVSGVAMDEMAEHISNESRGFFDDFTDRYFSGPPELKALLQGRPVLL